MSTSELLPNRPVAAMIPDDNNAREIIRYFIDVQKRANLLGVISSHAEYTQTDVLFSPSIFSSENKFCFFLSKKQSIGWVTRYNFSKRAFY